MAVNISDIAAMNAIPEQIIVSIAISNRFSLEAIDALYEGIKFACDDYQVDLVGGDTSSSTSGLMISVTAIGRVKKGKESLRKNARVNDIICVTGDLGGAYLGLNVLEREKQVFLTDPEMQPKLEGYDYIIQRQLKPKARMDIIHELGGFGVVPSSMIDISDGLASELLHIANQSGLGLSIYEDKIPIDKPSYEAAIEFKLNPITCALNGGEDYELLFTIDQSDFKKLENHYDITMIGHMTKKDAGVKMITKAGGEVGISAQGWNHLGDS